MVGISTTVEVTCMFGHACASLCRPQLHESSALHEAQNVFAPQCRQPPDVRPS